MPGSRVDVLSTARQSCVGTTRFLSKFSALSCLIGARRMMGGGMGSVFTADRASSPKSSGLDVISFWVRSTSSRKASTDFRSCSLSQLASASAWFATPRQWLLSASRASSFLFSARNPSISDSIALKTLVAPAISASSSLRSVSAAFCAATQRSHQPLSSFCAAASSSHTAL